MPIPPRLLGALALLGSGALLGAVFLWSGSVTYFFLLEYLAFLVGGVALWALVRPSTAGTGARPNPRHQRLLLIPFLGSLALGLHTLGGAHLLPPMYFFFALWASAALLFLQILAGPPGRWRGIVFAEIVALAAILRAGPWYVNQFLWGPDTYVHYRLVEGIMAEGSGSLEEMGHYFFYPFYHLTAASLGLAGGGEEAAFHGLALGLLVVTLGATHLLVSRLSHDPRIPLVACLLMALHSYYIFATVNYSISLNPLGLVLLALWGLLRFPPHGAPGLALFWLLATTIFFIHPVLTAILLLILAVGFLSSHFARRRVPLPFSSYGAAFVGYLVFVNVTLFEMLTVKVFTPRDTVPNVVQAGLGGARLAAQGQLLFAYLGLALLGAMAVPTVIRWLGCGGPRRDMALALMLLHLLPLAELATRRSGLDPTRFLPYATLLAVIPAASTVVRLVPSLKIRRGVVLILALALLLSSSTTSYLTTQATPLSSLIGVDVPVPTASLVAAHDFVLLLPPGENLSMDQDSWRYIASPDRGLRDLGALRTDLLELADSPADYYLVDVEHAARADYGVSGRLRDLLARGEAIDDRLYDGGSTLVFHRGDRGW